jgi:hypothetical protein
MYEVLSRDDIRKVCKLDDRQTAYEQGDLNVGREVFLEVSQGLFLLLFLEQELQLPLQRFLQGFLLGLALELEVPSERQEELQGQQRLAPLSLHEELFPLVA